jgi:uncharacterized membrane protein
MTEPSPPETAVDDYEVRAAAVERLTFFADAVLAIAITLLALDLPIPGGTTNHQVLDSVAEHRDEYLAFLISFYVIGAHWRSHHSAFRYVTTLGGYLPRLTMTWLLMQVITPFATRVLTGPDAFQARFVFYAAVQTLSSVFFLLMLREVRRCDLLRPGTPPGMLRQSALTTTLLGAAFLISIPVSFATHWAYACWGVIPFLGGVANRIVRRRAAR